VVAQRGLRSLKQAEANAIYTPDGIGTPCEGRNHNPPRSAGNHINRHYQGLSCTISQRQLSEGGGAYAKL
jgi:hypothetical protein